MWDRFLAFAQSPMGPAYLTALAAILVSPVLTYFVTKIRIQAEIVSNSRKEWINQFRDNLSSYLVHCSKAYAEYRKPDNSQFFLETLEFHTLMNKLLLSLNPRAKGAQREIAGQIESMFLYIRMTDEFKNYAIGQDLEDLRYTGQLVLKEEWDRVRDGEPFTIGSIIESLWRFTSIGAFAFSIWRMFKWLWTFAKWIVYKLKSWDKPPKPPTKIVRTKLAQGA